MVSTMITRNAGRRTAATRGRETSEQDGREGERSGDQAGSGRNGQGSGRVSDFAAIITQQLQNLLPTIVAQVGNHVNNQGSNKNQDDNVTNDNNQGNVRTMNNILGCCSYKEFMACNPKEYDGKGGVIVYTRWIEKNRISPRYEWVWKTKRLSILPILLSVRLVSHLVTLENKRIERYIYSLASLIHAIVAATEPTTIQSVVLKAGMLTDEAIRNGALKKNSEKRGNSGEPSRDRNARDDNKRSRTRKAFSTTTNLVRKEYTSNAPKCTNCNYHHQPEVPCRLCTNCNRLGHLAKDCKVGPRVVNSSNAKNPTAARRSCFKCDGMDHYKIACPRLNQAPRPGGNRPNQAMVVEGGQGHGNNGDQARGRAFMMGAGEARRTQT
ncbi:putative reverse transcriptase domain-containing protein [Tanacetum coccineum]